MSDYLFYLLVWLYVSFLFGVFICPRLFRKAPGGKP